MVTDFAKLGLKAGLEVHQQLDTGKLFCRCSSVLRDDKPDITFRRKLRAVASELGEFDAAALEASEKELTFEYQAYQDTTCLIEADEAPPLSADKEALETVLKISLMAGSKIMDEMVVMRKAVVDGSNTSAFQRTMLVSVGGKIKIKNKSVGIQSIALEEDSARPIERKGTMVVYRLDRSGIPLIELATAPDLKTPEEVKECAMKIGELFRRTCKAKRGLGTIRQDVNISIAAGARVEIKGVQQLEMIDEFVRREVQRQVALVELKKELELRKIGKLDLEAKELSNVFKTSECKFLKGKTIFGTKINGLAGLLGKEVQPGKRFGTELAGYVKARAGLKGILHSDELPAYGVSDGEIKEVGKILGLSDKDAFVLVQAEKKKAERAFVVIARRIASALEGVPEETRNALEDGNTEYSRPLPGAARMYPETDLDTVRADAEYLKTLKGELPLEVKERAKLYKSKGLGEKLAQKMVLSNKACFFENLIEKGINATTAAFLLLETAVQLKRQGIIISNEMIGEVLAAEKNGKITKDVFIDLLKQWGQNPEKKLEEIAAGTSVDNVNDTEINAVVEKIVEKNLKLVEEKGMRAIGALMGEAMKELKGRVSGKEISAVLSKEIAKKSAKK
ncbi:MAG: Glu-tRNA(Gln) amidotransferase subunit GatE [archaeon]|jgi:glutamyl-tRNA(Gln) amidotransferase subunit E|nr:Glu-tRNA(Gln) amidotransferase subunit GatE [archaeon]